MADFGPLRQVSVYIRGVGGEKPKVPVNMATLEAKARRRMSKEAFAYIAGGAGTESTVSANRAAFERWRIVPRMLRDVAITIAFSAPRSSSRSATTT
jgi:lactate 2-monooxygenase